MLGSERIKVASTLEAVNQLAYERGWTDGLPIVPPTVERVERMVEHADLPADKLVAELPPKSGRATVEKIAVNAVMAGCLPEYLPVIIAAVEALGDPSFNLSGVQATTGSTTPMLIVNGPVVRDLDINCGLNALGPGKRTNATIGRAIRLILQNVGGGIPGRGDQATLGQPGKYTFCFAENEEMNPWDPLHVERGYSSEDSTVTVTGAAGIFEIADSVSTTAEELLITVAHSMAPVGCGGLGSLVMYGGNPVVILCPEHAAIIHRDGFSKDDVKRFLWENSQVPLSQFSAANREVIVKRRTELGDATPEADRPVTERPEDILVVVAGGAGAKSAFVPAWTGPVNAITRLICRKAVPSRE